MILAIFLTNKTSSVNFVDTFPEGEGKKIDLPQGKYNCRQTISLTIKHCSRFTGRRGAVPYAARQI